MSQSSYVREIDGLRALAVLSVLLYHCEFSHLPGGFTGVDVFFVISGFLISRVIIEQMESGRFSFADFFVRRIARIAPALLVTMALTAVFFSMVYPPVRSTAFRDEVWAGLASMSNIYFHRHLDYFSSAESSPVLHTWSLAVEEQFYLVLPVFLMALLSRGRRWLVAGVVVAMFVSFSTAQMTDRLSAFYLPWFRAWELLAGVAINFLPTAKISFRVKGWLSLAGLAMIVAAFLGIRKDHDFPGWRALIPVLGACLCIVGASGRGLVSTVLTNPLAVFFGKVSYSLYLVHWPLCSAALVLGILGNNKVKAAVVFASIVLAWLSWRFVEKPCRHTMVSWPSKQVFAQFAGGTVAVGFLAFFAHGLADHFWRAAPEAVRVSAYLNREDVNFRSGTCFLYPDLPQSVRFDMDCLNVRTRRSVLLIGDSHAANINEFLRGNPWGIDVLQATATGCKPLLNATGDARCVSLNKFVFNEWLQKNSHSVSAVVISARWHADDFNGLSETLRFLNAQGLKVVVVGPHPEYHVDYPLALAYEKILKKEFVQRIFVGKQYSIDEGLKNLIHRSAEGGGRVQYFSVLGSACPMAQCRKEVNGVPLLSDRDHFTQVGVHWAFKPLIHLLSQV